MYLLVFKFGLQRYRNSKIGFRNQKLNSFMASSTNVGKGA